MFLYLYTKYYECIFKIYYYVTLILPTQKLGKLSKHISFQNRASCTTVRQEFPSFLHHYLSKICSSNYLKPKSTLQFTSIQAAIIFNIKNIIMIISSSFQSLIGTCLFPISYWNLPHYTKHF